MNTSSELTRYRTLVSHLTKVYAAEESARTTVLQEGLDDIVTKIQPTGWRAVTADSRRLLTVWKARESRPGTDELAGQILDSLEEFSREPQAPVPPPVPAPIPVSEPIHIPTSPVSIITPPPIRLEVEEIVLEAPRVDLTPFAPAIITVPVVAASEEEIEGEADEDDAEELSLPSQDSQEGEADEVDETPVPAPAPAVKAVIVTEEVEEVVEEEEEVEEEVEEEEEEEVVEPEEEEVEEEEADEEEGMEVEKKIFRGRAYWLDVKTNKLYTVVGDDDVGDEVGKIVDGRPVFLISKS